MVEELRKAIASKKVVFGARETLKNIKKVNKIYLASDARNETHINFINKHSKTEILDMTKTELSSKLGLDFNTEVFGVLN